MALRKLLILRRPRSGRLEGRTALIQAPVDFLTAAFARRRIWLSAGFPDSRDRRRHDVLFDASYARDVLGGDADRQPLLERLARIVSLSSRGWSSENQRCTTPSRTMMSADEMSTHPFACGSAESLSLIVGTSGAGP